MNDPFLMCFHNIRLQQETSCDILADLSRHIVTLYAVYGRVFIGIFLLYFFIITFKQT